MSERKVISFDSDLDLPKSVLVDCLLLYFLNSADHPLLFASLIICCLLSLIKTFAIFWTIIKKLLAADLSSEDLDFRIIVYIMGQLLLIFFIIVRLFFYQQHLNTTLNASIMLAIVIFALWIFIEDVSSSMKGFSLFCLGFLIVYKFLPINFNLDIFSLSFEMELFFAGSVFSIIYMFYYYSLGKNNFDLLISMGGTLLVITSMVFIMR